MIQKYDNPLNKDKIKQGYERTKRNDKHKEETIIKKKQTSIIKDIGILRKAKKGT